MKVWEYGARLLLDRSDLLERAEICAAHEGTDLLHYVRQAVRAAMETTEDRMLHESIGAGPPPTFDYGKKELRFTGTFLNRLRYYAEYEKVTVDEYVKAVLQCAMDDSRKAIKGSGNES